MLAMCTGCSAVRLRCSGWVLTYRTTWIRHSARQRHRGTLAPHWLPLLRFGDLAADSYDWETDCSYGNDGRVPECGVGAGSGSSFDHFLQFAGKVGGTPLIVVNGEIDDPQQAAQWCAITGRTVCACRRGAGAGTAGSLSGRWVSPQPTGAILRFR